MIQFLKEPWPWYIGGPIIGLCVPILLLIGNKPLGATGAMRAMCAAILPSRAEFFSYDWRAAGAWSIALVSGILAGAIIVAVSGGVVTPAISPATTEAIAALNVPVNGIAPATLFSWSSLVTLRGLAFIIGGGFLVGFGSAYAGGCTSGHGVTGLAALQLPSLIALIGIFAGGIVATFVLIPFILR